jgi:membrane fusion protein, multidrug efflux system
MNSPDPVVTEETPTNGKRNKRLLILGALVAIVGISYGAYWLLHARYYEETDDAYVASDIVPITSEVAGKVTAIHVDDTQHVEKGQLLVELDRADAEVAIAQSEAELARTVREVRGFYSQADGLRSQIRERQLQLTAAKANLARREKIAADGAVSAEELQHAHDQVDQLTAALNASRESLQTIQARIDNTTLENHPQVLAASAKVREATLAFNRTRIVAPIAGTVARRSVQIGARIAPGTPLLAVVGLDDAWVDANFKEVQLRHLRVGQPVELHADVYGNDVVYEGRIAGLGAGSGSAFALLPAQNASGNWIKIVQRVPVRIALDPQQLADNPLRVGLSMHARIDLHDTSGPLIASQVRSTPQQIQPVDDSSTASGRIGDIIAANAGGSGTTRLATP